MPRYTENWDVKLVFNVLRDIMHPSTKLILKALSLKVVMLLSLVTGHTGQTFHLLDLECMHVGKDPYTFTFKVPLKN